MPEKVAKVGVPKQRGFLYFLDKEGDISRAKMVRRGSTSPVDPPEKVQPCGVKKENGWLYFIDKEGDVARSPRASRKPKKEAA